MDRASHYRRASLFQRRFPTTVRTKSMACPIYEKWSQRKHTIVVFMLLSYPAVPRTSLH